MARSSIQITSSCFGEMFTVLHNSWYTVATTSPDRQSPDMGLTTDSGTHTLYWDDLFFDLADTILLALVPS